MLLAGQRTKPLQVLYFFLFGVVVSGLSEGRVEGKLNFSRCIDIFSVFFPPVDCEWKCGRVWCCLQAFLYPGAESSCGGQISWLVSVVVL